MEAIGVDAEADLCCPLCEYNLRGLVEPRCPECGFTFTWEELRAADRNRHPWLFEHGRHRSLATFARTWWHNRLPWRFWRDVTPANAVNLGRLLVYWAVATAVAVGLLIAPLPHGLWPACVDYARLSSSGYYYTPYAGRPPFIAGRTPPTLTDWLTTLCEQVPNNLLALSVIGPPLLIVCWPWLSASALLIFQVSLRRAKISPRHVVRAAVYGCDFGLAVLAVAVLFVRVYPQSWGMGRRWLRYTDGVPLAYLALFCGLLATVRLGFAYARYMRFHLPWATVLASQVVVVVFVWTCLTLTTDLSDLFR